MNRASWMVCKAFLEKEEPHIRSSLIQSLASLDQELLEALPSPFGDPTAGFDPEEEQLQHIHFSWFTPFLRTLAEGDVRLFLSSLSHEKSADLTKVLLLSNHFKALNPLAKKYLNQKLLEEIWEGQEPTPISCLPHTPLNKLLSLSSDHFLSFLQLLGVHDLSLEVRQIIDKVKLRKVDEALTPQERQLLKQLSLHKEPISFGKMGLGQWEGDQEELRAMLYQRGLNRLAKALYGPDNSLALHLSRKLDNERGQALLSLCTNLENPKAHALLQEQCAELLTITTSRKS